MAETTHSPEPDLAVWGWSAAGRACPHAVDIGATGMSFPDALFTVQACSLHTVMLLDAQIPDRVTIASECCQELQPVVLQCLAPMWMAGADGEYTAFEA